MNKDSGQKDMLSRHFAALGYYVQPEVIVFFRGGVQEKKREITDIDVLGLRPSPNLNWEFVLGDCKTHKNISPANRIIWLKGLMSCFSSSTGIIIFQRQNRIDEDHKLFASSVGITLLEESEFERYDKSLIFPTGSSNNPFEMNVLAQLRVLHNRYPALFPFCDYIYNLIWNEDSFVDSIRKVIGETQTVARELDPNKTEHVALVLDAAGVFAIGLAELVGKIFNQYLQPQNLNLLDEAVKMLLWGGRYNYEFIARLRSDLMAAKGVEQTPLTLPNWDQFLLLVRTMLDNPVLAFSVPQILRLSAIDELEGTNHVQDYSKDNLLLLKFGMMVLNYFCRAGKLPARFREQIEAKFIKMQSQLVHTYQIQSQLAIIEPPNNEEINKNISIENQDKKQPGLFNQGT